jgi:hypothetical protein
MAVKIKIVCFILLCVLSIIIALESLDRGPARRSLFASAALVSHTTNTKNKTKWHVVPLS